MKKLFDGHDRSSSTNLQLVHVVLLAKMLVQEIGCLYPAFGHYLACAGQVANFLTVRTRTLLS
jgi:hypothetical protein